MSKVNRDKWDVDNNKALLAGEVCRRFVQRADDQTDEDIIRDLIEAAKEYKSREGKPGNGSHVKSAILYARKRTKGVKPAVFAALSVDLDSEEIAELLKPAPPIDDVFAGAIADL